MIRLRIGRRLTRTDVVAAACGVLAGIGGLVYGIGEVLQRGQAPVRSRRLNDATPHAPAAQPIKAMTAADVAAKGCAGTYAR